MTDAQPTLAHLAAEENELRFAGFTNDDAWAVGSALVATAQPRGRAGRHRDHPQRPAAVPRRAAREQP